ncbi:7-carboxy-7-deazaguanine synthase [Novosphingobium sp. AAP1]|uniref:7-carboxy-7-deazaguanine synthase n=1 Tax=Novosphingobium sp. AAP1 TaxID=1523413 RepID=UPI0006B98A43|nr:7-carboxy-7-deazaguanine synthase [Novosphingobium sp. AAP1]KPF54084.1 7-carboxy-7-deazaguanine synthase [Novosphingobium sp. AAP1]
MSYAIKDIFKTLHGEGAQMGPAAVFCRYADCNLWSGREGDRATSASTFCGSDFVSMDGTGGGRCADADALADAIAAEWRGSSANRYVVLTEGEPLLQVDDALVAVLHARDFEIGVDTNGTQVAPAGFRHLAFNHFFLQQMDLPTAAANLEAAITYCTDNPRWRLSHQSHKMIGMR